MKKKIIILGSTGSIGNTTIKILLKNKKNFDVTLLTANTNYVKLLSQAKKLKCKNIIVFNKENFFKAKIINKDKNIKIRNPAFEFVPKKLIKGVVSELGVLGYSNFATGHGTR